MSDTYSRDTFEQRRNSSSPLLATTLVFLFFLVVTLGGFAAYRFLAMQRQAVEAALTAEHQAAKADQMARLKPLQVDPETGKLSPIETAVQTDNSDPHRPPDIGDFELTERSGKTVTNKDLLGQPWAVCFVFTRCAGECLMVSGKMRELHTKVKDAPVRLVTITVDPDYDTPDVLANYADNFGADPDQWLFLTGEKDYVYRVLRGYFLQLVFETTGKERKKGFEVIHTDDVLHIDAQGRIVKRYHAKSDEDMIRLRKALLAEARELADNPPSETQAPAVAEKPQEQSGGE